MTLRFRILLTGGFLHFGTALIVLAATGGHWLGLGTASLWVAAGGYVLRKTLMPKIFPYARCHHCRTVINLTNRWACGGKDGHYVSGEPRHILDFHCPKGHELGSFKCPECRTSILVRWMNRSIYSNGEALDEFPSQSPEGGWWSYVFSRLFRGRQAIGQRLLLGSDRRYRMSRLRRFVRRLFRKSVKKAVQIPEWVFRRHIYLLGGTGSGKSNAIENLADQMFRNGDGATFLDPTGDQSKRLLKLVPEDRKEDVQYINVMDEEYPFPFNVLKVRDKAEQKALLDEIIEMLERLNAKSWGSNIAFLLRKAFRLVMEVGGSFQDVYDLFTDPDACVRLARQSKQRDLKRFWLEEFPSIPYAKRAAVVPKLEEIVFHPFLRPMLCTRECLFDADEVIAKRKIVIVNLSTGSPSDQTIRILGACVINMILAASFRQEKRKPEDRVQHSLFIDEAQRFMGRATVLDAILSEVRKYKLVLILAHQYLGQLSKEVGAAILGNVKCFACFCVGINDAEKLKKLLRANEQELTTLGVGKCVAKVGDDIHRVDTPRSPVDPVELAKQPKSVQKEIEKRAKEIIALNQERIAAAREETEETLPDTKRVSIGAASIADEGDDDIELLPVFGAAMPRATSTKQHAVVR